MKKILCISIILSICLNLYPNLIAKPQREFRGAWIATVMNIDWPSSSKISSRAQKQELLNYLDLFKADNLNAVIFQIRPSADAFYKSNIENWSKWLTGTEGTAPKPFYDPLAFLIKEAKKRCLEVHVWLNPYRAVTNIKKDSIPPNHITKKHPEWFLKYGNIKYFDPGIPEVQEYICKIVKDIVSRYDIDAVHFDDYFYPYKIKGYKFPDSLSYKKNNIYSLEKDEWRRENVNNIIKKLNKTIKEIKPYVKFGISPFGVWRNIKDDPNGSNTKTQQTNYDHLHADVLYWLNNNLIDYVAPQLYWRIGHPIVGYKILAEWWENNSNGIPLYIGHGIYKLNKNSKKKCWRSTTEISKQIEINREYKQISGSIFYSAKFLLKNRLSINDTLQQTLYKYPALINNYKLIDSIAPKKVDNITLDGNILVWDNIPDAKYYIIYKQKKHSTDTILDSKNILYISPKNNISINNDKFYNLKNKYDFYITAVDRLHNESKVSDKIIILFQKEKNKK